MLISLEFNDEIEVQASQSAHDEGAVTFRFYEAGTFIGTFVATLEQARRLAIAITDKATQVEDKVWDPR